MYRLLLLSGLFFLSIYLLSSRIYAQENYDIYISKVFFDGTDEWIEITNGSDENIEKTLTFSGLKSTGDFDVFVSITSKESIIIGDKATQVQDIPAGSILQQGFVVKDTPVDGVYTLGMSRSGSLLHDVIISSNLVSLHNDISQPIIFDLNTLTRTIDELIEEQTLAQNTYDAVLENSFLEVQDVMTGAIVSSGVVLSSSGSVLGTGTTAIVVENEPLIYDKHEDIVSVEDKTQGQQEQLDEIIDSQKNDIYDQGAISIVEVYPYDTEAFGEYVLLRYDDDITAPYILEGGGRSGGEILVDTCFGKEGDTVLLTDSPHLLLPNLGYTICSFPSINLTDTGEILSIKSEEGLVIDTFSYIGNSKNKTQAILSPESILITPYPYSVFYSDIHFLGRECLVNISGENGVYSLSTPAEICHNGFLSNKRSVEQDDELFYYDACDISIDTTGGPSKINRNVFSPDNQGQKICDIYLSFDGSDAENTDTQSNTMVTAFSGTKVLEQTPSLIITEVFPFDTDQYDEYIELFAQEDYEGTITLIGLGSGDTPKTVDLSLQKYETLLITDDDSIQYTHAKIVPSITLTNSGEYITLLGQDGQVMDEIVYVGGKTTSSLGFGGNKEGEIRVFDQQQKPSPGFSSSFLLDSSEPLPPTSCSLTIQGKKTLTHTSSINFVVNIDGDEISNNQSNYNCSREGEYLPDNFDFTSCNPTGFIYPTPGLHEIDVEVYRDGLYFCTIEYSFNLPEENKESSSSYSQELPLELKDDYSTQHSEGDVVSTEEMFDIDKNSSVLSTELATALIKQNLELIEIKAILPNPKGADGLFESIELLNLSNEIINLEDVYIDNGRSRTNLMGTLMPHEQLIVTQKLGLYNSASCMRIRGVDNLLLDELCYPKPKDDVWYSKNSLTIADLGSTVRQSDLSLFQENGEICVQYNKNSLFCQKALADKDELKALQSIIKDNNKEIKKLNSSVSKLTKNEVSLNKKIDTQKQKIEKSSSMNKLIIAELKEKHNDTKLLVKLHEEFIYESIDRLRGPRQPIYEETEIGYLYTRRREIQKEFDQGAQEFAFGSVVVSREDLVLAYKIRTQTVGLEDMPVIDLYGPMLRDLRNTLLQFKQELTRSNEESIASFEAEYNRSIFDHTIPSAYIEETSIVGNN